MTIHTLLVANRGEIAVRIFETCRRLGVRSLAVVTPDDRGALHARRADEVLPVTSYLDAGALVDAAVRGGAEGVHPGYGFLAESSAFAAAVHEANLIWVGPPPDVIRRSGNKLESKRAAASLGIAVLASGDAGSVGFPALVKAAGGGGGRGMRVVRGSDEVEEALAAGASEAAAAFGDGSVFLERYLERPRHVEIQLLGDRHGTVISLGERDCSIQRRHQKLLEESPAPGLGDHLRGRLTEAAIALGRSLEYQNAGTVEFLVDGDEFYFLEVNPRIQVEHPVTEAVTGLDLVEWQLRCAVGESAPANVVATGHAIEARLYAEHPLTFAPQTGRIESLVLSGSVRVEHGAEAGDEIGAHYDPLIAKLVASGPTRDAALAGLAHALRETSVGGLTTNLPFLRWLVDHPSVRAGEATTAFLREHPPLSRPREPSGPFRDFFRLNRDPSLPEPSAVAPPRVEEAQSQAASAGAGATEVIAPTPGTVLRVLVTDGDRVEALQALLVLEAMKMEMPLAAPYDAVIQRVHVAAGDVVTAGALLVELSAPS
jgi:acetyl/propionyl-CoA carboxylase alpha subunit